MKNTRLFLLCVCCVAVVSAAWGQSANGPAKPPILGYLDPATGAFRPVPQASEDVGELTLTTFGGTITVTLTITLKSTSIAGINCSASVSAVDNITAGARSYEESATVGATGSGTTRTCKITIPYSWALATQASDTMTTNYFVSGSATTTVLTRISGLTPLDSRKVPANGATTNLTAAVTL